MLLNTICTINTNTRAERGEYTGYSHTTQQHHVSLYNGAVIKLPSLKGVIFDKSLQQLHYRVDGGQESIYSSSLEEANQVYDTVVEDFGEACIREIIEEWDEEQEDWDIMEENIIKSNMAIHND